MAIKILALDGLNDQKLCALIVQLLQTIPSVQNANIDYLSQKLTLQIDESARDIEKTIAEVSLSLKENIPGVSIRLAAVGENQGKPANQGNNLNFSKERAKAKEEQRLKEEQQLAEEQRQKEADEARLLAEAEAMLLEEEQGLIAEQQRLEQEAIENAEELGEAGNENDEEPETAPLPKVAPKKLSKETVSQLYGIGAAVICFLLAILFSSIVFVKTALLIIAFLIIAIFTMLSSSAKNNDSSKITDMIAVMATGIMFFTGNYFEAVLSILLYSLGAMSVSLIYDGFYDKMGTIIDIKPKKVLCVRDGAIELIDPLAIVPDDEVIIEAGQTIPFDGVILEGSSDIDRFLLTGDNTPKAVQVGDNVSCGDRNITSQINIMVSESQVTAFASRTYNMVMNSQLDNTESAAKKRKWNTLFFIFTLLCASGIGFFAYVNDGIQGVISYAPMFLLLILPCGAVASANLCYLSSLGRCLKQGIIVTAAKHLETLAGIKTIIMGYTGVLTKGEFALEEIICDEDMNEENVLEAAAYTENGIDNPIAKEIVAKYTEIFNKKVIPSKISYCEEIAGGGARALIDFRITLAGTGKFMADSDIAVPPNETGKIHIYVSRFGKYMGAIVIDDPLREGVEGIVAELKAAGVESVGIMTGCDYAVARAMRKKLSLDNAYSEKSDEGKIEVILGLMEQEHPSLLFAGDESDSEIFSSICPCISMGNERMIELVYFSTAIIPSGEPVKLSKAIKIAKSAKFNSWLNLSLLFAIKTAIILLVILLGIPAIAVMLADIAIMLLLAANATSIASRN